MPRRPAEERFSGPALLLCYCTGIKKRPVPRSEPASDLGGAKGIRTPDLLHAIYGRPIERASTLPFWPRILRSPQSAEIRRGAVRLLYSTAVQRPEAKPRSAYQDYANGP